MFARLARKLAMRKRTFFIFVMAVVVLLVNTFSSSDGIFKSAAWLIYLARGIVVLTIVHWARKAYLDYGDSTDLRKLFAAADPGRALIAIAIFFLAFATIFASAANAQDIRTYVPPQAHQYMPTLRAEVVAHFFDAPHHGYVGGLIEHESGCFALKKKCWNPRSELKSAREQGAGLGQITRAYRSDGTERFDALQEMVDRYPQLKGWNWGNVFDRPDLQMRAVVLKVRDDYRYFAPRADDAMAALQFADAAYNGGRGGVEKERTACALKPGCDPGQWFGHVEHVCMKSRAPLYGNRSACDINRHHVKDVFVRADKYLRWLS
ncbi:MAG: lytic murein transglycosylase [Proteobacteria bacterium]|nr:lytic murein transglycosylase [Pseudomonadota bacterium]